MTAVVGGFGLAALADGVGTLAEPVVPVGVDALCIGMVLVSCVAGAVPAWRALRYRPAEVVRTE